MHARLRVVALLFALAAPWFYESDLSLRAAPVLAAQTCGVQVTSLTIGDPVVRDTLDVHATVSTQCELQSVEGSLPGQTFALTFNSASREWYANVSLLGLPNGPFVLTVTATDVVGNTDSRSVTLTHHARPVISIAAPEVGALARPIVHVSATCQDDDPPGCTAFTLRVGSVVLVSATSSIDQDVSLAQFDGQVVFLSFDARDVTGGQQTAVQQAYVESSPILVESVRVPGTVLDDSATQTLFYDDSSQVSLFDKATEQTMVLLEGIGHVTDYGYVTPTGAIFVSRPASGTSLDERVYEWRDGGLIDHGLPNGPLSLRVSGGYAIWSGDTSGQCCQRSLFFEDLLTGSIVTLEASAGNTENDVNANGDAVYWTDDHQIVRYRDGVKSTLTSDTTVQNIYPVTDGVNVAYQARSGLYNVSVRLITPDDTLTLAEQFGIATPRTDYAVSGAWTAYVRSGLANARNVWVRSPDGVQTRLTFYSDAAGISALNDDGRVAFVHNRRMWITQVGGATLEVGGNWPAFWRAGNLYVIVGRSVLQMVSPPVPRP